MKRLVEDKLYIQLSDIDYLMNNYEIIPDYISIILDGYIMNIDEHMEDDDFICFIDKRLINYFYELDYIINYDEYKDLSVASIADIVEKLNTEINQLELIYKNIKDSIRKDVLIGRHDDLDKKAKDLTKLARYKQGKINFYIPGEEYHKSKTLKRIKYILTRKKED